jgi:hypothetical protein
MSQLKFKKQEVLDVIEHSIKNSTDKPQILLVGDEGVYIMTGGPTVGAPIAYASGCDPEKDDWYDLKVNAFGGDDGVEYLGAEDMKKAIESHPSCKYLGFKFKGRNMEVFTV